MSPKPSFDAGADHGALAAKHRRCWWQTRTFIVFAAILAAVPLVWPTIPPLTDLPGHMADYRILAEAGQLPLARDYAVDWAMIGNLGVELLVLALHSLLGIELATKLVVMAIPPLTVLAMLWAAHEAHGHMPPTATFALPLAYALPFQLGFVNFALSQALVIGGLALWLRLARTRPAALRIVLFAPIACVVWLCHQFGWAMLGLFIFAAQWALFRKAGRHWLRATVMAGLMCLPMALPVVIKAALGGDALTGPTGDWLHGTLKLIWVLSLLRERWQAYDVACAMLLVFVLLFAWRSPRLSFSSVLGAPALLGAIAFILLPRFFEGGSYVDMRMLPASAALALLAVRDDSHAADALAIAATAFYALRIATSTIALALFAHGQSAALEPIKLFPAGSSVLVLVEKPALGDWRTPRLDHLDGIAVERRRVFTNGEWGLSGQQIVRPTRPDAAPFDRDPSQLVEVQPTGGKSDFDKAISTFNRNAFDYVWTIDFPVGRAHVADLRPIWTDGRSAVYRVVQQRQMR